MVAMLSTVKTPPHSRLRTSALALALTLAAASASGLVLAVRVVAGSPVSPVSSAAGTMPFSIERLTESFAGTVREVLNVSGYTYVAVDTGTETRWVVVLAKHIDEGAHVRVRAFGKKDAFESKKLGRTFDELWFALITQQQQEGDRS